MSQLIELRAPPPMLTNLSGSPLHCIVSSETSAPSFIRLRVYPGLHPTVIVVPYSTGLVVKSVGSRTLRLPSSHPLSLGSSEHSEERLLDLYENILYKIEDNFRCSHTYLFTLWLTIRHGIILRPIYTRDVLAPD